MAQLVYSAITSLDGYVVDADGSFAWAAPDEQVHAHANELERSTGTYLLGRRMYEVLTYWETALDAPDVPDVEAEYARLWLARDKVVYSTSLDAPRTARTRIERTFDADAVRAFVDDADADVSIGGPTLAAHAIGAGIVDVLHHYAHPVVVGGGTNWLPDGVRLDLLLEDVVRFDSGVTYCRYARATR